MYTVQVTAGVMRPIRCELHIIIIIIIIKFIGHKIQLDAKITQKGAKAKNA